MCEREATIIREPHEACLEPPTEPATYKHQPLSRSLDEIRLLKLRKEEHGPVHCEVEVFPLEQAPEYIALSYRWGPPSPLHDIFIGDETLQIRDILNLCLLELREDVDAWLWIDQICIAQADTAERNHQVGMMSRIYSNATSVIIWLSDVFQAPPGEVDHFNDQDLDDLSVVVLLRNVYFTRLWIVQEVLLAKRVKVYLNGNRSLKWSTLHDEHIKLVLDLREPLPMHRASMLLVRNPKYVGIARRGISWIECINSFSANSCEDPRDKVYGMMGVVKEEDRFTIDYTKSVLEVFLDVVNAFKHSMPRKTLVYHLFTLGTHMGIEASLILALEDLAHERLEKSLRKAVSPMKFKKADREDGFDYWWYECNGEEFRFPPRTARRPHSSPSLNTLTGHLDGQRNVRYAISPKK